MEEFFHSVFQGTLNVGSLAVPAKETRYAERKILARNGVRVCHYSTNGEIEFLLWEMPDDALRLRIIGWNPNHVGYSGPVRQEASRVALNASVVEIPDGSVERIFDSRSSAPLAPRLPNRQKCPILVHRTLLANDEFD
jgi:hypothetical protein